MRLYGRVNIAASIDRAGVRPLLTAQPTKIMNAIAAHKDELEKLLVNLSHHTAVSGMGFVALLDAYITGLDTNCSDVNTPVGPALTQTHGELTWNQH
ncbi:MAG: hypothetical protein DME59_18250 [Verrucomicrobia bacterium]|nr:MAG: hypothetical protein DME59_18250 [Verrucomicrobiota bacterium]PYL74784.1 MAG: hypothetical protein DMF26_09750 [Verrucomicrobiota bacterium]